MLAFERHQKIEQLILNLGKVQVAELSNSFNVTEETIRRDLEKLEQRGVLTRIYGGATAKSNATMVDQPFLARKQLNAEAKECIAHHALPFLKADMSLFADSSSTVLASLHLAKAIPLTIISNSINLFSSLGKNNFSLISTGGNFNSKSLSFSGSIAEKMVCNYFVDVALISCKALSINEAITESNQNEVVLKRLMIKRAKKVFLLADSSKFNQIGFTKLLDFNDIDYLVTDRPLSNQWQEFLSTTNIKVITTN